MKNFIFALFTLALLSSSSAQDFGKPMRGDSLQVMQSQARLLKGASIDLADELIIESLMDNDWIISVKQLSATKVFFCRPKLSVQSVASLGEPAPNVATLRYSLEKASDGVVVKIYLSFANNNCSLENGRSLESEFYDKFWRSASFGKFYKSIKIAPIDIN